MVEFKNTICVRNISANEASNLAVRILETVVPKLTAHEQSFFVAGFQECMKYINQNLIVK